MLNLDEKQLKNINSRTNLKKFLDHVLANNVEKVGKMCNKGLDPNFHCPESGETPLLTPKACVRPRERVALQSYFELGEL